MDRGQVRGEARSSNKQDQLQNKLQTSMTQELGYIGRILAMYENKIVQQAHKLSLKHIVYIKVQPSYHQGKSHENVESLQDDLFAARADEAGSPSLEDGILVGWRTFVVLLAPDEVPGGGEKDNGGKNHRCVVHRDGCDRQEGRHAEEGSCESRPSYVIVSV